MQTLYIGTYAGIPVKIHWTFGLMVLYVLYISNTESLSIVETLWFSLYIGILFFCVVLHEYGHALMARKYGVKTIDILISPIGGLARLERLPKKPSRELAIAIAGPLVNVAIALVLALIILVIWDIDTITNTPMGLSNLSKPITFLTATLFLNIILFAFNLIPAFPMDGGRILRALLGYKFSRVRATNIAAIIGQLIAGLFILFSLYGGLVSWGFIGLFVIFMARNENRSVKLEAILEGKTANDIMKTNFSKLFIGDQIKKAVQLKELTGEQNFLVFDSLGYITGILPIQYLKQAVKQGKEEDVVMNHMSQNYTVAHKDTSLKSLFNLMNTNGLSLVAIKNDDQLLGIIDRHNIQKSISRLS